MSVSETILGLTVFFYSAAFVLHLRSFYGQRDRTHRTAFRFLQTGFIAATFYFILEAATLGTFLPVADISHALAFFAWSLAFVYLVLLAQVRSDSFGLVLTPVLMILAAAALFTASIPRKGFVPSSNPFFMLHILSAFFAYASFALSFAAGILYLIQRHELKSRHAGTFYHQLPSLEELERLIDQPMFWGTALLLAAVAIGFFWAKSAFGAYTLSDPKTVATFIVAAVYSLILGLRLTAHLRAKQAALFSVAAFVLVILSFVGMRFIHGSHNFLA